MHVHVVFAHYPLKYPHILSITYLNDKFSAALLYLASQDMIAVLRNPY